MKLGTRLFVFSSVFLVMLPWFAFHFVGKIEDSLLQGQEEAQSMVASAIATVLSGYSEIFDIDEHALYVHPVYDSINIDGYEEDWGDLKQRFTSFSNGAFSLLLVNTIPDEGEVEKKGANIADEYFYVYLKVVDDNIVYRNPRYYSLDSSDHLRLEYIDVNNNHRRLVLLAEGQGNISAYEVKQDWTSWLDGKPVNAIYGVWRETKAGYSVELRLPRKWLRPAQRFSLSVVDVFSENERYPERIVSTHSIENTALNPLLFQSQEISSVLKHLSESDSRICVVDRYRRVRAVTGGDKLHASFCQAIDKVSANLVNKVLQPKGDIASDNSTADDSAVNDSAAQVEHITENGETLIIAARAVYDDDEIIGAVLVSKNSQQILSLQRDTLNNIVLATLGMFLLVFFSLLIFSWWLAFRINRLNKQMSTVIDDNGRLIADVQLSDRKHGDEIGDLSRSFESMILKLNSYTNFLETVPRMLRHEILNPINTISMSLQRMSVQNMSEQSRKSSDSTGSSVENFSTLHSHAANISTAHINIATNAIKQLQLIVSSLTEAANIDEALIQDEIEAFDIAALLDEYVCNSQSKHKNALLRYEGVVKGVIVKGNDIRLVQLLDKIKDNALDFSYPDTEILFMLEVAKGGNVVVRIKNEGEIIPQQQLDVLFHGMVSHRSSETDSQYSGSQQSDSQQSDSQQSHPPHLGIGLYVAHKIAQFHKGKLQILNRRDKQGVEVSLILPSVPGR